MAGTRIKTDKYPTTLGELSVAELKNARLPYGRYSGRDNLRGIISHWHLPDLSVNASDHNNVYFTLLNIKNYPQLKQKYKTLIASDPIVKWNLIPFLFTYKELKDLPKYKESARWIDAKIFDDAELFHSLADSGAEYIHYLDYAYANLNTEDLALLLRIFPDAVKKKLGTQGSLLLNTLTNHFHEDGLNKARILLEAGANINEVIDNQTKFTLLQHLIMYNQSNTAILLIDLAESLTLATDKKTRTNAEINYLQQDAYGRTPLFLAVARGEAACVKRLLQIHSDYDLDIGLNTPDNDGRTPIMIAVVLGHETITHLLLNANVDLTHRDCKRRDLNWYMHANKNEITDLLRSVGIHFHPENQIKTRTMLLAHSARSKRAISEPDLTDARKPHTNTLFKPTEKRSSEKITGQPNGYQHVYK